MRSFAQVLEAVLSQETDERAAPRSAAGNGARVLDSVNASALEVGAAREETPAWARDLQLSFPCTAEDVRKAFRQRAFATHPDRPGGSAEAFRRAQSAFDAGVRALTVPVAKSAASKYRTHAL